MKHEIASCLSDIKQAIDEINVFLITRFLKLVELLTPEIELATVTTVLQKTSFGV